MCWWRVFLCVCLFNFVWLFFVVVVVGFLYLLLLFFVC